MHDYSGSYTLSPKPPSLAFSQRSFRGLGLRVLGFEAGPHSLHNPLKVKGAGLLRVWDFLLEKTD